MWLGLSAFSQMTVCVAISLFAAGSAHGSGTDGDHCFSLLRLCLLASLLGPYQEDHSMGDIWFGNS